MKRLLFSTLGSILVTVSLAAQTPQTTAEPISGNLTPLMRMKLDKSKAILEGLTLEDFDKIAINAKLLKLLSTESGWNVIQTAEYASQSSDFRRATDLIAEAAEEKDIHRAMTGYVALTVRCVECHSYMRKLKTAAPQDESNSGQNRRGSNEE